MAEAHPQSRNPFWLQFLWSHHFSPDHRGFFQFWQGSNLSLWFYHMVLSLVNFLLWGVRAKTKNGQSVELINLQVGRVESFNMSFVISGDWKVRRKTVEYGAWHSRGRELGAYMLLGSVLVHYYFDTIISVLVPQYCECKNEICGIW